MHARRTTAVLTAMALALAACGGGQDDDAATASDALASTTIDASGGATAADGEADHDGSVAAVDDDAASAPMPEAAMEAPASADRGDADAGDEAARTEESQQVGLQAGSVDDNENFEQYLAYRDDIAALGLQIPALDVLGRRVLTVVDGDGRPVHDAVISHDGVEARTGSDGRALVYVDPDSAQQDVPVVIEVRRGDAATSVELDGTSEQQVQIDDGQRSDEVRLDLLFLIDATGSMADEIGRLRDNMTAVAEAIAESDAAPDVRFALTSYRDVGDEYVARTVDFTGDVEGFVADLAAVEADGGGDRPEAFNEAFDQAVHRPSWRTDEDVVRLIVVVADAPPHLERRPSYVDTVVDAAAMGIRVFPIASSGTDDVAEFVFRQVAQATLGRFVFLTYGADGRADAAVGSGSNVDEVGYDVLALDDLVVRLVEEQLAPLVVAGQ